MEAQAAGYQYPPYPYRRYPEPYRHTLSREEDVSARRDQTFPQPAPVGAGVRPQWPPGEAAQVQPPAGRSEVERPEGGARSEWQPAEADRDRVKPVSPHVPSHRYPGGAGQEVPVRRSESAETTPEPHTTNQVRFRYVKPADVVSDGYGRLYEGRPEARPHRPAGEGMAEHGHPRPHHEHPRPHHPPHHVAREQWESDRSRQMDPRAQEYQRPEATAEQRRAEYERQNAFDRSSQDLPERSPQEEDYESRRRAHHEKYLKELEERRMESARRRAEEERRRAEHSRIEEDRRRAELLAEQERIQFELDRAAAARPTPQQIKEEEIDVEVEEVTRVGDVTEADEDLNGSVEVSQYPERLPPPRALLPEEFEQLDK